MTALVSGAALVVKEISKEVEKSDTGMKIQSNEYYPDVKNVAVGTVHVVSSVFQGMYEAMKEIGTGI